MDCSTLLAATIGDGYLIGLLSRIFHTTCAATLLGGTIYLRFVLAPAAESADDPQATLFAGRRQSWAMCVGICSALLLLSGFYNFFAVIRDYEKPGGGYHAVIGVKILLALAVMAFSAMIAGKSGASEKGRAKLKTWMNITLFAALSIFAIGGYLKSIPKMPRIAEPSPLFEGEEGGPASDGDEAPATDGDEAPAFDGGQEELGGAPEFTIPQ